MVDVPLPHGKHGKHGQQKTRHSPPTRLSPVLYSEADPTSPGTDKDVDYYQHKSNNHNNFMPWRTGWEAASDTKLVRFLFLFL